MKKIKNKRITATYKRNNVMKTAHEWYLEINSYSNPSAMNDVEREWVEKKINEARKEAIEECAERAKQLYEKVIYTPTTMKQTILNLVKELK